MPMPLSSDKLHLTMTKSSTFSGLRDALLAVTTFPAAENTLSDFELAAGTGKTILTRCERSVKYTLQLSWFALPKTRPEPDPKPGLLTITWPEPDPNSKSAIRHALERTCKNEATQFCNSCQYWAMYLYLSKLQTSHRKMDNRGGDLGYDGEKEEML